MPERASRGKFARHEGCFEERCDRQTNRRSLPPASQSPTDMRPTAQASSSVNNFAAQRSLLEYFGIAAIVAAVDLLSKFLVVRFLGIGVALPISERLALFVTFNTGSAGGVLIGPYTWHLNVIVTTVAMLLITTVVRQLAAVDPRATVALGFVLGGAVGNLCSMLFGPEGVADFFAIKLNDGNTMIMNGADAALWTGAFLLLPVVARLLRAIRAERRVGALVTR